MQRWQALHGHVYYSELGLYIIDANINNLNNTIPLDDDPTKHWTNVYSLFLHDVISINNLICVQGSIFATSSVNVSQLACDADIQNTGGCLSCNPRVFDHSGTQPPYFKERNNSVPRRECGWDMRKHNPPPVWVHGLLSRHSHSTFIELGISMRAYFT